jgi:hypothetical protein
MFSPSRTIRHHAKSLRQAEALLFSAVAPTVKPFIQRKTVTRSKQGTKERRELAENYPQIATLELGIEYRSPHAEQKRHTQQNQTVAGASLWNQIVTARKTLSHQESGSCRKAKSSFQTKDRPFRPNVTPSPETFKSNRAGNVSHKWLVLYQGTASAVPLQST